MGSFAQKDSKPELYCSLNGKAKILEPSGRIEQTTPFLNGSKTIPENTLLQACITVLYGRARNEIIWMSVHFYLELSRTARGFHA
jgi:hypothetical protein